MFWSVAHPVRHYRQAKAVIALQLCIFADIRVDQNKGQSALIKLRRALIKFLASLCSVESKEFWKLNKEHTYVRREG